jgi:hypothetical protein
MSLKYEIKPILPDTDGRIESLPRPAVNLAQRLTQLANHDDVVIAQVIISQGNWTLQVDGRKERMGNG